MNTASADPPAPKTRTDTSPRTSNIPLLFPFYTADPPDRTAGSRKREGGSGSPRFSPSLPVLCGLSRGQAEPTARRTAPSPSWASHLHPPQRAGHGTVPVSRGSILPSGVSYFSRLGRGMFIPSMDQFATLLGRPSHPPQLRTRPPARSFFYFIFYNKNNNSETLFFQQTTENSSPPRETKWPPPPSLIGSRVDIPGASLTVILASPSQISRVHHLCGVCYKRSPPASFPYTKKGPTTKVPSSRIVTESRYGRPGLRASAGLGHLGGRPSAYGRALLYRGGRGSRETNPPPPG